MSQTIDIPKRWPLVIQPENRSESTNKDARLVNAYVEMDKKTQQHWLIKRPGLLQTGNTQTGNGYGIYNWKGDIYAIFGATVYKNGVALAGTVDTTGGVYRFSSCLGGTPKLQFGNGVHAYNYDSGAGIVQIDGGGNVNFPTPFVKGWSYLDGTTYVSDSSAKIHGCDALNTPQTWTDVLNVIVGQIEPDGGVATAKQLVYTLLLKEWTTEVFYDATNATGSPLGPVQGAKLNFGCASADSVQEIDGALFWICTNRSSQAQVIKVDNLKPTIISTKPIERLLGEADFSSVLSFAFKYEGHKFYVFTLKNNNLTLVYDDAEDMWAQWTDPNGNYLPIVGCTYNSSLGRVLQHETNGKMYSLDSTYYTDDGSIITVDIYTPNFDAGVDRIKYLPMLYFDGDQTAGSTLQVRCNDFDYDPKAWSNFRKVNMGQEKPYLEDNGSFYRRAYHIRHQSNTRLRMTEMGLQLGLGTL